VISAAIEQIVVGHGQREYILALFLLFDGPKIKVMQVLYLLWAGPEIPDEETASRLTTLSCGEQELTIVGYRHGAHLLSVAFE
jgi:hypothetical protein